MIPLVNLPKVPIVLARARSSLDQACIQLHWFRVLHVGYISSLRLHPSKIIQLPVWSTPFSNSNRQITHNSYSYSEMDQADWQHFIRSFWCKFWMVNWQLNFCTNCSPRKPHLKLILAPKPTILHFEKFSLLEKAKKCNLQEFFPTESSRNLKLHLYPAEVDTAKANTELSGFLYPMRSFEGMQNSYGLRVQITDLHVLHSRK